MPIVRYIKMLLTTGHIIELFGLRIMSISAVFAVLAMLAFLFGYVGIVADAFQIAMLTLIAVLLVSLLQAGMHVEDCSTCQRRYLSYLSFRRVDFFCLASFSVLPCSFASCLLMSVLLFYSWPAVLGINLICMLFCPLLSGCISVFLCKCEAKESRGVAVFGRGLPSWIRCPSGRIQALAFHGLQETRVFLIGLIWLICVALALFLGVMGVPVWILLFVSHIMLTLSVLSEISERESVESRRLCFRRFSVLGRELALAEAFILFSLWVPQAVLICFLMSATMYAPFDIGFILVVVFYCVISQFALAALFSRVTLRRTLSPLVEFAFLIVACIPFASFIGILFYFPTERKKSSNA